MARRWSVVLAGLAVVLSAVGTTAATAGTAPHDVTTATRSVPAKATRLTLTASADEVEYATQVTLSGKLTAAGKGVKRQKVVLKVRPGAARTWTKLGTVTTNRRGGWTKVIDARVRATYAAVYQGTRTYRPSKAATQRLDVIAPLTDYAVSPGNRDAYKDETWTFTARTAPELAGSTVSLFRGPSRLATKVGTATIGPGGAVAVAHQMADVGQTDYWLSVDSTALLYGVNSPRTIVRTRREGAPTAPSITTTSLPVVEEHVPYQVSLVGGGGELAWSVVGGTLPPGLSLAADGTITGTAPTTGSWSFTVRASNVAGEATRTVAFTSLPGTLSVTTLRLYDAAVGGDYPDAPYSSGGWQAMACTPCAQGATWDITSGTLPPGMGFVTDDFVYPPASYVYGRPTQAGVWQFTLTGVAGDHSGSKVFTLRVLPSPSDLIVIQFDGTLSIPSGTLGQPYSHQFVATNDAGVTWAALTQLPPGLTLSPGGLLSGTPSQAGSGWIDVAASDGTRYDWQGFAFTVSPAP